MDAQRQPEILPPASKRNAGDRVPAAGNLLSDANLDLLSHLLDDFLRIPGTPIRFGLDGIVGFVPGVGDLLGGVASSLLIVAAWVRGVAYVTLLRMVLNVAIETLAGSIPVLGNLFDIGWRANRRNYALLTKSLEAPRHQTLVSWLVLGVLCLVLALLAILPGLLLAWLVLVVFGVDLHR